MNVKEKIKRFKELSENISILRANLKILEDEKKALEADILNHTLHDTNEVVVDNYLVFKKEKEFFRPDKSRLIDYLGGAEKFILVADPAVGKVKRLIKARPELEKVGRFEKKYYVDVKLLKVA